MYAVQELYNEFIPAAMPETGPRRPVLISYNDETRWRLHHLQPMYGFDPLNAELDVLRYSQLAQSLAGCKRPLDVKVASERAARFHALLTHCLQREHISPAGLSVNHGCTVDMLPSNWNRWGHIVTFLAYS